MGEGVDGNKHEWCPCYKWVVGLGCPGYTTDFESILREIVAYRNYGKS